MQKSASHYGFTLIELLIVVAIIAVLSGFLIPGFTNYMDNQSLRQARAVLVSDLRNVQNKALTGVDAASATTKYWGLKVEDGVSGNSGNDVSYMYFKSEESTAGACNNAVSDQRSEIFPGGVVIRNATGACVFFSLRNGDATIVNMAGDTLGIAGPDKEACHGVQINSAGLIRGVDLCT